MKFAPILVIMGIGVVVVGAIGFVRPPWQATTEFSFAWFDGGGLIYR